MNDDTHTQSSDDTSAKIEKSDREWRQELTPAQYDVLRRKGTEPPFTGRYVFEKRDGTYRCAACGTALFSSDAKFESGTGWPSFTEPASRANIELHNDHSFLMRRVEVTCAVCGGHLGHVFPDGPGETGERFCINSAALDLDDR
ncbi:MAG: peptide-methionine (R)-S-oxide reductase MsrB [Solirubrobacteraceae bacterium]